LYLPGYGSNITFLLAKSFCVCLHSFATHSIWQQALLTLAQLPSLSIHRLLPSRDSCCVVSTDCYHDCNCCCRRHADQEARNAALLRELTRQRLSFKLGLDALLRAEVKEAGETHLHAKLHGCVIFGVLRYAATAAAIKHTCTASISLAQYPSTKVRHAAPGCAWHVLEMLRAVLCRFEGPVGSCRRCEGYSWRLCTAQENGPGGWRRWLCLPTQ
jgi:hypothetical protein